MNDMELADRIEQIGLVRICHETGAEFTDVQQQIIAALRRGHEPMNFSKPLSVRNDMDVRGEICKIISRMLDHPDGYGIYPTTRCYDELESFIKSFAAVEIGLTERPPSGEMVMVPRGRIPRLIEAVESMCRKAAVDNDERVYEVFTAIRRELRDAAEAEVRKPCPLCGRTDPHSHTSGPLGMS